MRTIILFVFALCVVPVTADVSVTHVEVEVDDAEYAVAWRTEPKRAPVDVWVSQDPNANWSNGKQIAASVSDGVLSWQAEGEPKRHYFTVVPKGAEDSAKTAAVRLLPLEGGRNFRDLGGYETTDGRSVKWGHVYRSGVMANLTGNDYDYLSSLGVKAICDYRSAEERQSEPTRWQAGEVEYVTFPDPATPAGGSFMSVLQEPDATPEKVMQAMADGYSQIAKDHAPAYEDMFDRLAAGEIPLAFNCSAGKDRAGTSAAFILTALGVPREQVVADYALSETFVDYMKEFVEDSNHANGEEEGAYAFLAKLPRELVAPLMRSAPIYIESTFRDLESEYGSVMNFIQTELKVTDAELASIRANLLE